MFIVPLAVCACVFVCVCVCVCVCVRVLVQSAMLLHNLADGKLVKKFPLAIGSVSGYSGKRYQTEMFYSFVSFLTPGIFYRCDMTSDDLVSTVIKGKKRNFKLLKLLLYYRCFGGQKSRVLMKPCLR